MGAENISGSDLDSAVNSSQQTIVVFFWAAWNAACRASMPTFEQAANGSSLPFYKFDVDSDQSTTTKFGIRAVPTVSLYKGGQLYGRIMGAFTTTSLDALVAKA